MGQVNFPFWNMNEVIKSINCYFITAIEGKGLIAVTVHTMVPCGVQITFL